jgi:hypothetical protein
MDMSRLREIYVARDPSAIIWQAFGERTSIGTTATGEDIWRGTATTIPNPPDVGEQMSFVSTDAADSSTGTGIQGLRLHYIDAAGAEMSEDVSTNGTTTVSTVATDIRFVNDFHAIAVGSNGVAEGDITVHQFGTPATEYSIIILGGNQAMVPRRMVPAGKKLYVDHWNAAEAGVKQITFRIRSTDKYGVLIPGVFCFKGVVYLNNSASGDMEIDAVVPAFSIMKITGWASAAGGEASCNWIGHLVDASD